MNDTSSNRLIALLRIIRILISLSEDGQKRRRPTAMLHPILHLSRRHDARINALLTEMRDRRWQQLRAGTAKPDASDS